MPVKSTDKIIRDKDEIKNYGNIRKTTYLEVWTAQAMSDLPEQGYHTTLELRRLSRF